MESEVSLEPPEVDLFCVVFLDQPRLNAEIGEEREVMPAGKLSKVLTGNHDGVRGIPGTTGGGFVLRRVPRPAQVERRDRRGARGDARRKVEQGADRKPRWSQRYPWNHRRWICFASCSSTSPG